MKLKWLEKILGIYEEDLTVEMADQTSRYGTCCSFDQLLKETTKNISCRIKDKLNYDRREKLLSITVPSSQKVLYEEIKRVFAEKGFKTFYVDSTRVEELSKDTVYLFISWDVEDTIKEAKGEKYL